MDGPRTRTLNGIRLFERAVGASVLAVPLVGEAALRALGRTLDSDPSVTPLSPGWAWIGFVVAALAAFALAEVFRQGADLRQFEMETV